MNQPDPNLSIDLEADEELALILADITDRQLRGESVSIDEVCQQHPAHERELRMLWATVMVTQAVGEKSTTPDDTRTPLPVFELPMMLGDFRLEKELGRGGMGVVFLARQLSLDREVALKMILKGQFANEEDRRRFRREAEAAAKITHPNIVSITEFGEQDGNDFFCMEYIRGGTLSDRLAKRPLPPREAAKLVSQIARAIAAAHENGILHRDIKPSNILIGTSGTPYIADFGLAKHHQHSIDVSRSGSVVGTPAYMAPEQVARGRGQSGPTSDIYSLGAMLYHMLTGRAPFQAASPVDVMLMVLEEDPVPVRFLNRKVDRDLEMIVMKCLQKPQDLRYQDANQLANDLEAYLADDPISARDGRLGHVMANMFRETHHASVLENWGLLWMWHSLVLFLTCFVTNTLYWSGVENRWTYWFLWAGGFGTWALVFWYLRRRQGPVTFVERQIAHTWAGAMVAVVMLFPLEWVLGVPVLSLAPVMALIAAMNFVAKAGILNGMFYIFAVFMVATGFVMALIPQFALLIYGVVVAICFFTMGFKYHRQRKQSRS